MLQFYLMSILISHFYCTMHLCANCGYIMHIALRMSSVHPSVTLVYCDHTHRDYQKVIFWINSVILPVLGDLSNLGANYGGQARHISETAAR